jgi:hypothetical protein
MTMELLKLSLVAVDGKPLAWDQADQDRVLESVSPMVRQLLIDAFGEIHSPKEKDRDAFLASKKVRLR